jgi:quinone-reactive Ni/Fe-hydrogenase small subunit
MRVVIVGGGIAAAYLSSSILEEHPDTDLLIISKEQYAPYDRIHLCSLVDGSCDVEAIALQLDPRVRIELDQEITSIDTARKQVIADQAIYHYDKLIIATGSKPKALFDIHSYDNATTFRSAEDSFKIAQHIKDKNVVIVGSGPIGLELLDTLTKMPDARSIYLLSRGDYLYSKDLNPYAVAQIREIFESDPRITILLNDHIQSYDSDTHKILSIHTRSRTIDNPFLIFGVGIEPNVEFARKSLECDRGILVDETMRASDPDIYVVGEAAQLRDTGYTAGRVKECTLEADTVVANLFSQTPCTFAQEAAIDGLKVGAFLFSDVSSPEYRTGDPDYEDLIIVSKEQQRIDQYILQGNRLMRFIGVNSNIDVMQIKRLIESQQPVDAAYFYANRLVGERGRLVCSCEGVFEQDLTDLIKENAVADFGELKGLNSAGRTCGRCKKDVADLIAATPVDPEEAAHIRAQKAAAKEAAELEKIHQRIEKYNRLHSQNQLDPSHLKEAIEALEMSSEYNRWVSMVTAGMRLPPSYENTVHESIEQLNKIPIIWLELSDCSGNSEAFIKTANPRMDDLILQYISLDYHELLMAAAGDASETALESVLQADKGRYILIVEGAIPLGLEGKYLRIGPKGETGLELLRRTARDAAAVLAVGSCAFDGGVVAAAPNPTEAVGVSEALGRNDVINLPGCPVNPINVVGTLLHYLMFDEMPQLDTANRPLWAYSQRIHDNCERRGHYDLDEFVLEWGDEGAKNGWCLFKMGCKGPYADLNCSLVKFNEGTSWPVQVGHGCFACGQGKIAFDTYANNRPLPESSEESNHE